MVWFGILCYGMDVCDNADTGNTRASYQQYNNRGQDYDKQAVDRGIPHILTSTSFRQIVYMVQTERRPRACLEVLNTSWKKLAEMRLELFPVNLLSFDVDVMYEIINNQ